MKMLSKKRILFENFFKKEGRYFHFKRRLIGRISDANDRKIDGLFIFAEQRKVSSNRNDVCSCENKLHLRRTPRYFFLRSYV